MTRIVVCDTGHPTSQTVCVAFAQGCGAPIRSNREKPPKDAVIFFYGGLRYNSHLFRLLQGRQQDFLFCDNGYMRRGHFDGYYRITRNAWCHDGQGEPDYERLDRLNIEIQPWRRDGRYILLCPPVKEFCVVWRFNGRDWARDMAIKIKSVTKRPIVIRYKPGDPRANPKDPPLEEHLAGAWAVVAHDSNVALEAIIAGVPAFVTGPSPARPLALTDVSRIRDPWYPDNRREVLAVLAANQWTLDEMKDGTAQRMLGLT